MVEQEFAQIWQRLEADRKEGRLDDDDKDKDEETLKADYRAIAERRVRLGLLLAEIGRVNSITVAPDEMTRAMRTEAARYPGQEQQMMEFFRKNPQRDRTRCAGRSSRTRWSTSSSSWPRSRTRRSRPRSWRRSPRPPAPLRRRAGTGAELRKCLDRGPGAGRREAAGGALSLDYLIRRLAVWPLESDRFRYYVASPA